MKKQILGAAGILTAGLLAGSAFSITSAANAADETNKVASSNSVATTQTTDTTNSLGTIGAIGGAGHDDDSDRPDAFSSDSIKPGESLVTGDALTKLTDAALATFPGATVIRVENDSDGDKYEVHLKKADGSVVTVTFDENFAVTGDHEGFADGSKGGPHGPRGDHDGDDQGEDQNDD